MLKSRSLIIVVVIVIVLTLSTTAFATCSGWCNNAVKILQNSTHYSSFYNMGTKIVGTLGHWAHAESGTEVLRITPQYYYNNTLYSSHPKDANIYKNATFVEKTWTLDGAFQTRFRLQNTSSGSYAIFSTDVGYFYDK